MRRIMILLTLSALLVTAIDVATHARPSDPPNPALSTEGPPESQARPGAPASPDEGVVHEKEDAENIALLVDILAECNANIHRIIEEETALRFRLGYTDDVAPVGDLLAARIVWTRDGIYKTSFYAGESTRLDIAWLEREEVREMLDSFSPTDPEGEGEGGGSRSEEVPPPPGGDVPPQERPLSCVCVFDTRMSPGSNPIPDCVDSFGATYQVSDGVCDREGCENPQHCTGSITVSITTDGTDCPNEVLIPDPNGGPGYIAQGQSYTEELDLACDSSTRYVFGTVHPPTISTWYRLFARCHTCEW